MLATSPLPLLSTASSRDQYVRVAAGHGVPTASISAAFSRHGGVVRAEEAALLMRPHFEQPISQLARWIVGSNVVHFTLLGQTWIPLFQFHVDDMSIRPAVRTLLSELAPLMEADELACWFVDPNEWLSGASPLESIDADFPAVLEAARADRFVMGG